VTNQDSSPTQSQNNKQQPSSQAPSQHQSQQQLQQQSQQQLQQPSQQTPIQQQPSKPPSQPPSQPLSQRQSQTQLAVPAQNTDNTVAQNNTTQTQLQPAPVDKHSSAYGSINNTNKTNSYVVPGPHDFTGYSPNYSLSTFNNAKQNQTASKVNNYEAENVKPSNKHNKRSVFRRIFGMSCCIRDQDVVSEVNNNSKQ